jgi:hypothetical protein
MKEAELSRVIKDYLQFQENLGKLYFVRNNSLAGTLLRKNGYKSYVRQGKKGSPDFIVLADGKYIGLELKGEGGKLSPEQEEAKKKIEKLGGIYKIITSLEDLIEIL